MRDRQLLFFSASIDEKTIVCAKEMSKEAIVLTQPEEKKVPKDIEHLYVVVGFKEKMESLRKLVRMNNSKKAMIFQNGAFELEEVVEKLKYHKFNIACIHGSVGKKDRQKAIEDFTREKVNYLVATDIAARGLHFDGVDTVYHLSIPEEPMDYLHRAGRTGRNGTKGTSILIVTKAEIARIKGYQNKLGIKLQEMQMRRGELVSVEGNVKKPVANKMAKKPVNKTPNKLGKKTFKKKK